MTLYSDSCQALIQRLQLQPHPEGGFYSEVFRSDKKITFGDEPRCASTSIYYLLMQGDYSAWHRIDSDETWYFLAGQRLLIHVLDDSGSLTTSCLGDPLQHTDAQYQYTVAAGHWFAAELADDSKFALAACHVAPGFEFSKFELAKARDLAEAINLHGDKVARLLRA